MGFDYESDFEGALIKLLKDNGWTGKMLNYPTEAQLIKNWAEILFNNNKGIDRLNGHPLTDSEMQQILDEIKELRTPLALNGFINGKSVSITRDNPADSLHFGKEVSLTIYNRLEIASGRSFYQIARQPKFERHSQILPKRRGDLLTRDGVVSVELIKNCLQGIATNPTMLLAMSKAELQSVKECVGKSKTEGTYQNLYYSDKMLTEFVKDRGNEDIPITVITEDLFEEYRFYLKKQGLAAATINRYLCWLSRLMYRAVSQRLIRCNPFENVKYEKTEQKIRFLQKKDVAKLMSLKVNDKDAEQARRMFIFACFTGLAIADMEHLQYGHIQTAADGQRYIRKERQKTKVEFVVPLHPIAEVIIKHCKAEQKRNGGMQSVKEKA